jgi:hypothetical protein
MEEQKPKMSKVTDTKVQYPKNIVEDVACF